MAEKLRTGARRVLRLEEVMQITALTKDSIHKMIRAGQFPDSFTRGRVKRWRERDVAAWLESLNKVRVQEVRHG